MFSARLEENFPHPREKCKNVRYCLFGKRLLVCRSSTYSREKQFAQISSLLGANCRRSAESGEPILKHFSTNRFLHSPPPFGKRKTQWQFITIILHKLLPPAQRTPKKWTHTHTHGEENFLPFSRQTLTTSMEPSELRQTESFTPICERTHTLRQGFS